jgi:HipA-like protein
MSDPDILDVWYEQRLVGQLWRNTTGAVGFRYYPEWITGGGFAVSRSLPLAAQEFAPEEGAAQRWFANLLPEGAAREHIVRDLKLPNTDFDLLRAIGGECAGAVDSAHRPTTIGPAALPPVDGEGPGRSGGAPGTDLRFLASGRTPAIVARRRTGQVPDTGTRRSVFRSLRHPPVTS